MGIPEFCSQNIPVKRFYFLLVFENKSGATLPGLDREALCLSPEWELLGLTA